jgi:hypothetical protein
MNFERAAMKLATEGFRVFPVTPDSKRPPLIRFKRGATADPPRVAELWRTYPHANIGVATGGGTMILDVDSPAAQRLVDDLQLAPTTTVKTPRGGRHFYFRGNAPTKAGARPGLDIRGRGGYAVGPGSIIGGKRYEWIIPPWELEPQPAPRAVLELVKEREKFRAFDRRPVPQGRRNETLTRIAGWFVGQAVGGEALEVALGAVNRERCRPPLPDREVEKIVNSASKWDVPPLWLVDPVRFAEDPQLDGKSRHVLSTLAARARHDGHVRGGEWLREVTGWDRKTIYRVVGALEEAHRIEVRRGRSKGKANDYKLLPFEPTASNSGKGVPDRDYPLNALPLVRV